MAELHNYSRYLFCQGIVDARGKLYLTDRQPFRFVERSDNRHHIVQEGDTLFSLAHQYFQPLPRPDQFFWCIADFQPEPIIDVTLALRKGTTIVIPSPRCLVEEILNGSRRPLFEGGEPVTGAGNGPAVTTINGQVVIRETKARAWMSGG